MTLTRDDILKRANDLPHERVFVKELGGEVIVRGMTGAQRDQFEASMLELRGRKQILKLNNVRARLIQQTAVDEDDKLLFREADIHMIGQLPATAIEPLFDVARRLSALTEADLDELGKNSESGQSDGSPSD